MENNTTEIQHKRRVRYKGTHPRKHNEKYKELNPEKYKDDIKHIIDSGRTPVGMHVPICVNEILEILDIKPNQTGLDCTLGYGGHTESMLKKLGGKGKIYALDVDPIESKKTAQRLGDLGYNEDILVIKNINYSRIDEFALANIKFDFVLADLGVSSMQIDSPTRGFTYKHNSDLDLRLNPEKGIPASKRLLQMTALEIEGMLLENADEVYAKQIASQIVKQNKSANKIATTEDLKLTIDKALAFLTCKDKDELLKKTYQRVFQAIRIDINNEYEHLFALLEKLPTILNKGGKVCILTFHSGEDRLVKKAFKFGHKEGLYSEISDNVILPSKEEVFRNSRSHSAKLRYAVKG